MKVHELKIEKIFFDKVISGIKKAELRKSDRDFQVFDELILQEYDQNMKTGRSVTAKIVDISDVSKYAPGYLLLSIELLPK